MAVTDFYDWNEHIKYPLVFPAGGKYVFDLPGSPVLPDKIFLDAGVTMGYKGQFVPGQHTVKLYSIYRSGSALLFLFYADSLPLSPENMFGFSRELTSPWGATDFTAAGEYMASADPSIGTAFLVTGDLTELETLIPDTATVTFPVTVPQPTLEPATVLSQNNHTISTVNVGNINAVSGSRCCEPIAPFSESVTMVATGLAWDIKFKAGYNMSIYVDKANSALNFVPVIGAGMGEPCNYPPLPAGIPKCSDLMYTINGVAPAASGAFNLIGSNGIYVEPVPEEHKIIIHGKVKSEIYCEDN